MPYADREELEEYITDYIPWILSDDPLVISRFYHADEIFSFYMLSRGDVTPWYGYLIGEETTDFVYLDKDDMSVLLWDTSFAPCPLSTVTAYLEH